MKLPYLSPIPNIYAGEGGEERGLLMLAFSLLYVNWGGDNIYWPGSLARRQ